MLANRWILIALILLLTACSVEEPEPPRPVFEDVPRPSLEATDVAVRQQLEEARERLDAQLATDQAAALPDAEAEKLLEAFGRLGRLYHAYDLLQAAAASYRNAEQLDAESVRWPALLGMIYQRQGQLDEAAVALGRARELDADEVALAWRLGEVEQARGRQTEARQLYDEALQAEPLCEAARVGLAELDVAAGDFERAVTRYKAVLANQPNAQAVHFPLAQALLRAGKEDEAQTYLRLAESRRVDVGGRALCPDPFDAELATLRTGAAAHIALGRRAGFAGQTEVELAEYRKALAIAPDDPIVHQSLGQALARSGRNEEALGHYQEAARLSPQSAELRQDVGVIATRLGHLDIAQAAFEESLDLRPDSVSAHWLLAQLLQLQGALDQALGRYEKVLELEPTHAEARSGRALALAQLGRPDEARQALAEILDQQPPADPGERFNLASGLGALGDAERAAEHLLWVAQSEAPADLRAQASFRAAHLFSRLGRPAEAERWLRHAAATDPDLTAAQEALQSLGGS